MPRRRWEDNIRMDLEEIGIKTGNWIDSAEDRDYWRALVNVELNFRITQAIELITPIKTAIGAMDINHQYGSDG